MNHYIWVGIAVGVFFMGIGIGYTIFGLNYQSNSFSDMMKEMMSSPQKRQQLMDQMMSNEEFMSNMQDNKDDSVNVMEKIRFNPNVPITIPLVDGYYDGKRVYFIHTEVSDPQMAGMMTSMVNFPTLYVPALKDISEKTAKVYVFTNGVPGMEPYGGGPFMFQIDIFDSIPGKDDYSQFRIPHLVTWNKDAEPRILSSEKELLEAEAKGELTIQVTDKIVNAPIVVWKENGDEMTEKMIEKIFTSMDEVTADVINVDTEMYTITMNLHAEEMMN